jgi:hypothetical protein
MRATAILFFLIELIIASSAIAQEERALTIIAIGDAGEANRLLRANAGTMSDMLSGRHDAGTYDAVIFLGDNFYNTGLNVAADDVEGKIKSVLGPFRDITERLGRTNVHAIAGSHEYYRRNAVEASILFGLVSIEEAPVGIAGKGNEREAAIPDWTYHCRMPAEVCYAIPGTGDSVQCLFLDTALPLRTDPGTWKEPLDSLRRLLSKSAAHPGIRWRVLCMHHPWYSVGEHAGYSIWDDEAKRVEYLTNCDKDSNAVEWLQNWLDPEDLCAEKYRAYVDSLQQVLHNAGVRINLALTAHDHSLQLLCGMTHDARCRICPRTHVISGAGCRPTRVKFPRPPEVYTAPEPEPGKKGVSQPGFVQLRFTSGAIRIVFFNGMRADRIDMGGGRDEFWINPDGVLIERPPQSTQ